MEMGVVKAKIEEGGGGVLYKVLLVCQSIGNLSRAPPQKKRIIKNMSNKPI